MAEITRIPIKDKEEQRLMLVPFERGAEAIIILEQANALLDVLETCCQPENEETELSNDTIWNTAGLLKRLIAEAQSVLCNSKMWDSTVPIEKL